MPHLVLEHGNNIVDEVDLSALFAELQQRAIELVGFDSALFKCRRLRNDYSRTGDGHPDNAFVSLRAAILSGRSAETIAVLGQGLVAVLQRHFRRTLVERRCDLSVLVEEMPRSHYFKAS